MRSAEGYRRILFLSPYPFDTAPGQRFRYEQYLEALEAAGFEWELLTFLDENAYRILYAKGHTIRKVWGVAIGFLRRPLHLLKAIPYDYVFVFRELAPLGPPVFEWLLTKVLRKKVIYDFDDAIWLPNTSKVNRSIASLKWHQKVAASCRWSYKVSCGNAFLCDYASKFNKTVLLNPTTIDTQNYHNQIKDQETQKVVIGWTGTHSTLTYLDQILPVLKRLAAAYKSLEFAVIADKAPDFDLPRLRFVPWSKDTEIRDLLKINIGVMPLTDDSWSKGKCGFKALQYMALGIPALISPVGVNTKIVDDGINGYLCSSDEEWEVALRGLIESPNLRAEMGLAGRQTVIKHFSVSSNTSNFLSLFT
jgi:glycosyltransferase involved in cell wall biosynthesis